MSTENQQTNGHDPIDGQEDEDPPLTMEVNNEAGAVFIEFNRPTGLVSMTGGQAIELAQRLVYHGKLAGFEGEIDFHL